LWHTVYVIWFDTAWAPPGAIFESLAQHFPAHEIVILSDDYDNHFHETFTLEGGQGSPGEHCITFQLLALAGFRQRSAK
jgi:hypothetical protein